MSERQPKPETCLAEHNGELTVEGTDGPIRIVRDRWGIPHIDATTMHDAFFGQGFAIAQDRLFQIELYRRMAHGTSAAMLNRGLLNRDVQNRRLGYGRHAEREWDAQSDEARAVLQAYADGVNAAVATQPRPFEFQVLGHEMTPWSPIDSLAVIKMVNAGVQWATRLKYGKVAARLGPEAVLAMVPDVRAGSALITPSGARWTEEIHPFAADVEAAMGEPDGVISAGGGSNCWVIDALHSDTGNAIVCGDPHLAITVPGQWYVVHMRCPEFTAAGPCNPCYPGPLFYGHNTRIAWTMTHAQGDRWDVYRERLRQGPHGPEALFGESWEPLVRREERFEVRGEAPETRTIWETRHGPVIAGDPERDEEVLAARWGLTEPAHDVDAILAVLRADDIREAREGFRTYDSVSGNFCFADGSGAIAYQYAGRIPKRPAWLVPVPGWDGQYEWDGNVPKDELPADENPPNGFILTANNRTTTPDYPHYLTFMATPFRANRLRELMDGTETFRLEDMPRLQGDVVSLHARAIARRLTAWTAEHADAREMQELLREWDGTMDASAASPLVYSEACQQLIEATVNRYYSVVDGLPPWGPAEDRRILFEQMMSDSPLMLGEYASWQAACEAALTRTSTALRERFGHDPSTWSWGDGHRMAWQHNLGRDAKLAPTFNLPDMPIGGDGHTPFNTQTRYGATSEHGVSYRQIFDLGDLNAARICVPPGNSGQPGSAHYADHLERWARVEYHPLLIDWDDIETQAEAELRLEPAG